MSTPHGPDPDRTRRQDVHHDPDATRGLDRTSPLGGRDGEPTEVDADATQSFDPADGPWEGTAVQRPRSPDDATLDPDATVDDEPSPRRGRDAAFAVGGLVLGFVLAFIVVALGASGGTDEEIVADGTAQDEETAALESELEDRDATIQDLETRLAEAEAAAGERDEDLQAQRDALDERAAGLDERATQLDQRESALDDRDAALEDREDALDEREASIVEREAEADPGTTDDADDPAPDDDTGDGDDPADELIEDAETIIDQVLEQIRELFGTD